MDDPDDRPRPGPRPGARTGPRYAARPASPEPVPAPEPEWHEETVPDDEWHDDGDWHDDDVDADWDEHEDYVDLRPPSSAGRRIAVIALVLFLALILFAGGTLVWVRGQLDPSGPPGDPVAIEVPEGATSDDIGKLLAGEGVIKSDFVWGWYLRINGGGPFDAGAYDIPTNSSVKEAIAVLEAGPRPPDERSFTIPEGLTTAETIARLADAEKGLGLDAAEMQDLLASGQVTSAVLGGGLPSTEGILFPETYKVDAGDDAKAVLQRMVTQLDETMTELDVAGAQERLGLTPYEILTVASLIEEETKVDEERAKVARVIYNRLEQGIPLGVDATSRYEAILAGRSRDDIDFDSDSPYNTRKHAGLPPTPIASPGRASIEAALHPADGPWIYYVLENADGHHFFTDSSREFINAKNKCHDLGLGCG